MSEEKKSKCWNSEKNYKFFKKKLQILLANSGHHVVIKVKFEHLSESKCRPGLNLVPMN
jgi:hypothetical protein